MTPAGVRIQRTVEGVRRHVSRGLASLVAVWCGTVVLTLLVFAPFIAGSGGWQAGSAGPLVMVILILALAGVGVWIWVRLGRRWCGERRITRSMEAVSALGEGAVLGTLELSRSAPTGTSPGLVRVALQRVSDRLPEDPKTLAGELGEKTDQLLRRGGIALIGAVATGLLVAVVAPSRALNAWNGLLHPLAVLAEPVLPPVTAEPGTMEVPRGTVVEVGIHAPFRDNVTLRWDVTGQVAGSRTVPLSGGTGTSALPSVDAEIRYWIQAPDGATSAVYSLVPVDPLLVTTFTLEVTYPPHTGLPSETYEREVPRLVVPAGTHLRIRGQGSRNIGKGGLVDGEGTTVLELEIRDTDFSGSWTPVRSGIYTWGFTDEMDTPASVSPGPLDLELLPDRPPEVEIVYPGPDTLLPLDLRQPLVIQIRDDYGIERLEIVAWRVSAFGEAGEPVVHSMSLRGSAGAVARPVLDVSDWRLLPGDAVRYLARSTDNHPSRQVGETEEHVLRMPAARELERVVQEELDQAADRVEALADEARRAEGDARDLERRSSQDQGAQRNGEEGGFQIREELTQVIERQDEITEAVDSLQRMLAELREALAEAGVADPELRDRLQGLEDLAEAAATEENRDLGANRRDPFEGMDPRDIRERLRQAVREQERLRQRLEDSVEQFKQAAIDQNFRASSREAEDLSHEQEILAQALSENGDETLRAEQQAALEERARELQAQLQSLQQQLQEAGERQASAAVGQAKHELGQARQQMQAVQGGQESAARAQQAAGDLSSVSDQLNQARMQMQEQMFQVLQDALDRTAAGALALARRQSELRQEMQGADATALGELRADEAAVARGIRNLVENYAVETEMAAPGGRDLLAAAGQAMEQLENMIEAMGTRRGRGRSPMAGAETVVRALNEVARLAITSGQQGEAQGATSASQQMMQQIQELSQQQGEIMQDASSLSTMQLGEETLAQQTEKVAERQEDVAQTLDQLSEERGPEDDPLGDLSAFAEEARQLAGALAGGRLDPEVLRRQERLFHRLLDAGRTLERDEESEERESERPGSFTKEGAVPLGANELDALRFRLPGAAALRSLSPAQRALVIHYFERLNRRSSTGSDGGTSR